MRYRITASPVTHAPGQPYGRSPDGKVLRERGTPTALHGPHALAWWQRRAAGAGLAVEEATLTPRVFERPPLSKRPPGLHHSLIQFDGLARVTDAHLLAVSVCRGIGRAQSYGAGLLSLAPA